MTLVELGRIVKPHGVRGELKVRAYFEGSETLAEVDHVMLRGRDGSLASHRILSRRRAGKGWLVTFEGIEDRDAAETLRNAEICVPREVLPAPGPGEYYLRDLIGARVVAPEGDVGRVIEVRVHPSVDSLVIERPDGSTAEQILSEPWVVRVDVAEKVVELESTEGLI